ncbi:hypothetical protein AX16_006303 [Volvariella volvacea WC 439]|nr:hypothetical protein AX16_006303 [Volvariella volvacea WC 439]
MIELAGGLLTSTPADAPQNHGSPIARLPVELLSRIFRYASLPNKPLQYSVGDSLHGIYRHQIAISGVCKSWRTIVLEDPILWTDIRDPYIPRAPELLRRSGQAPLSISVVRTLILEETRESFEMALGLISDQHHRVKLLRLSLHVVPEDMPLLWRPAPMLTHFVLQGNTISASFRTSSTSGHALFDGSTPSLRYLELSFYRMSWHLSILYTSPNLQELHIVSQAQITEGTLRQFLTTLRSVPNLRVLELAGVLPEEFNSPSGSVHQPKIPFPYLTDLALRGTSVQCLTFLEYISYPRTPNIFFSSIDGLGEGTSAVFQNWISNTFNVIGGATITSLVLSTHLSISAQFPNSNPLMDGWDDVASSPGVQRNTMSITWTPLGGSSYSLNHSFVRHMIKMLPLHRCTTFITYVPMTDKDWDLCIQSLPSLECLKLFGPYARHRGSFPDLLKWLAVPFLGELEGNDGDDSHDLPFPKLQELYVNNHCRGYLWDELQRVLKERKDKGSVLCRLGTGMDPTWNVDRRREAERTMKGIVDAFFIRGGDDIL